MKIIKTLLTSYVGACIIKISPHIRGQKGRIYDMQKLEDFSGNIKLRLPRSLHYALMTQAEKEGTSLNQLCLMYLGSKLAENYLGTEEFNRRLEKIEILCGNDEVLLFDELRKLNDDVEARRPLLLKAIREIYEKNPRSISDQMEELSFVYPIYYGRNKVPCMKIPSAKIVIISNNEQIIDFKEIERLVSVIPDVYVAYGDFDYHVPIERREVNRSRILSVVINFCCEFEKLHHLMQQVRKVLETIRYENGVQILTKPCYLHSQLY